MKNQETETRKNWMGVLARAGETPLEESFSALESRPDYEFLRPPEVGMVMVRGRADGNGRQFNLGEMTMTRCTVKLREGAVGHGYVAGRSKRHAELAAVFDAMLQIDAIQDRLLKEIIQPLSLAQAKRRKDKAEKTAATRVNFFTMVRGED